MAGKLLYLDSSAIVKLVVPEVETKALRELLKSWPERVSSVVARIEVERVARRIGWRRGPESADRPFENCPCRPRQGCGADGGRVGAVRAEDPRRHPSGDGALPRPRPQSSVRLRRSSQQRGHREGHRGARTRLSVEFLFLEASISRGFSSTNGRRRRDAETRSNRHTIVRGPFSQPAFPSPAGTFRPRSA